MSTEVDSLVHTVAMIDDMVAAALQRKKEYEQALARINTDLNAMWRARATLQGGIEALQEQADHPDALEVRH